MNIKNISAFFIFYFYLITGNKKRYELTQNYNTSMAILNTPVFMFVINFLITFTLPEMFVLMLMLYVPLIIGNFIIFNLVRDKGYEIKRKERDEYEKKRQYEKEREEYMKRARERLEAERKYREFYEGLKRKHWEEMKREQEKRSQPQQKPTNNNYNNAIKLLGLQSGASDKEIKSAYRKLSKIHHPDLGGLEVNFIKLNKAYNFLIK